MKTLSEHLAFYAAYHRNPWNVATHFVGIPAIIISLFIPLGWLRMEAFPVTGAVVFAALVWLYYVRLDPPLAASILVFIAPALYAADRLSRLPWGIGLLWFLSLFVGGWVFQLVGHQVFEKRKPAFMDNLIQLLIGPLFLVAETLFWLGFRTALREKVHGKNRRAPEGNA